MLVKAEDILDEGNGGNQDVILARGGAWLQNVYHRIFHNEQK